MCGEGVNSPLMKKIEGFLVNSHVILTPIMSYIKSVIFLIPYVYHNI